MGRKGGGENLGAVIGVRLPVELENQLQAEARELRIPISTHIRGLLQPFGNSAAATEDGYADGYKQGRADGIHHGLALVREAVTAAIAERLGEGEGAPTPGLLPRATKPPSPR